MRLNTVPAIKLNKDFSLQIEIAIFSPERGRLSAVVDHI
jgi:hypothetical protein